MELYNLHVKNIKGESIQLSNYKGKVLLIVNTASKCGLTPQFEQLEQIYTELNTGGFEIFGFPCNQFKEQDSGSNEEIVSFCQLNYGVTFPMFAKIDVNGPNEDPLYTYLKSQKKGIFSSKIKWNFTKFLVNQEGYVVKRYSPQTTPLKIKKDIIDLLSK